MKEQDKTPEVQLSEVRIGNLSEKQFRAMIDSKDDPRSQKKNRGTDKEDKRNV